MWRYRGVRDYEKLGFHPITAGRIRSWFDTCGLRVTGISTAVDSRFRLLHRVTLGMLKKRWSRFFTVTGEMR